MTPLRVQPLDFRVIVTGSRNWPWPQDVWRSLVRAAMTLRAGDPETRLVVVHGACPNGADAHAAEWVASHNGRRGVIAEPHPADWGHCARECNPAHRKWRQVGRLVATTYCPTAGFRRNQEIADAGADLCLAFSLNGSPGTADMVRRAKAAGIPVELVER